MRLQLTLRWLALFSCLYGTPALAQQKVLVATCGTDAACDKLRNLLARATDSPVAARIMTDRGLFFGEPNCEAAGSANRRCAWSHSFSLAASDVVGSDSDYTWVIKRVNAIASQFGLTPAQLRARTELLDALPTDWRSPMQ